MQISEKVTNITQRKQVNLNSTKTAKCPVCHLPGMMKPEPFEIGFIYNTIVYTINSLVMSESISYYLDTVFPDFEPELKLRLTQECILKDIPGGEVIMRTGQYIKHTLLIGSGRVKLYRQGDDGEEVFIYYLEPGNACALSMICNTKQEASEIMAKTVEDVVAIMIPIHLMDELMQKYKTWYYFVIANYRSRFEELLVVLDNVIFKGMDHRLESYLKNQFESGKTHLVSITHQQIANDLNTSREVVSRLLKKMEQDKKIRLLRNSVEWLV
jgi:CRP/FNR family transcriptional regulator, anaerobic regulatory protein